MEISNNEQIQGAINSIENADATPPHLGVTLRLVRSDGMQVLCRSLHLGCSVAFCELYLYTCMERGHIKGFIILLQLGSSDRVQGSLQFFELGFSNFYSSGI